MALTALSDTALFDACVTAIWAAARGESQGGDDATYNRAMDLMTESRERHRAAGHTDRCRADVYNRAYEKATAQHAFREPQYPTCDCGATT